MAHRLFSGNVAGDYSLLAEEVATASPRIYCGAGAWHGASLSIQLACRNYRKQVWRHTSGPAKAPFPNRFLGKHPVSLSSGNDDRVAGGYRISALRRSGRWHGG